MVFFYRKSYTYSKQYETIDGQREAILFAAWGICPKNAGDFFLLYIKRYSVYFWRTLSSLSSVLMEKAEESKGKVLFLFFDTQFCLFLVCGSEEEEEEWGWKKCYKSDL